MIIKHETLNYKTKGGLEFEDITDKIHEFVAESGVQNGLVNVQTMHTTTAIIVTKTNRC